MLALPRPTLADRSLRGLVLAGSLAGLMVLGACGEFAQEATPRLLTTSELRAGVAALPAAAPSTRNLEARAAALRSRAVALRAQTGDSAETRRLRERARELATLSN